MTRGGMILKTLLLLALMMLTISLVVYAFVLGQPWRRLLVYLVLGGAGSSLLVIALLRRVGPSYLLAPLFALFQGLFFGGLACLLKQGYLAHFAHTLPLSLTTLVALLFLYGGQLVSPHQRAWMVCTGTLISLMMVYLLHLLLSIFGVEVLASRDPSGLLLLGSCCFVGMLALHIVLILDFIRRQERQGLPSHMEWELAMALLLALLWTYPETGYMLVQMRKARR